MLLNIKKILCANFIYIWRNEMYVMQSKVLPIKYKTNNNKRMQKVKSNPKQPSCTKSVWKKMWNPKWQPRNGCDGRLNIKIFIRQFRWIWCQIRVKCWEGNTNSPELSLLIFLRLAYRHSHFLAATLDFLGCRTILQLGCFRLDSFFCTINTLGQ